MPGLNNDERNQAIQMLNAGTPATVISRHFGCSRKTIERLQRRFRVTGNVADRPRSGRPRVTTAGDDCYIVLQHLGNRRLTAAATERQYGTCIHPQTVRNQLRQNIQPIRAYRPYFGQILTRRHRTARRDWCRRQLHFRRADWHLILFSDVVPIDARVYRPRGERFAHACVFERDRYGGGSVFVCGGIMGGNKTRLIVINGNINVQAYINDVLAVETLPYIQFHGPNVTFS